MALLVLVQVKCKTVEMPRSCWHVTANSKDFSLVEPPAPQVTDTKSGLRSRMRCKRASKLRNPASVFGGKNSNRQNFSSGPNAWIRSTTDIRKVVEMVKV